MHLCQFPDYASPEWEAIPAPHRTEIRNLLDILQSAPERGVVAWLKEQAELLGVEFPTLRRKFYAVKNNGGDWKAILDRRKATAHRAELSRNRHPQFIAELCLIVQKNKRKHQPAFRALKTRWKQRRETIPGYEDWPGWPQLPAGWSNRNLSKIVEEAENLARLRSIKVGTSSKSNPFLPTVLTTRVGLWPGAVIQLDDVWHDNYVTFGKARTPARVIELGALDLFSANRFHFGAKPRRLNKDGKWETIRATDMRMFIAGMFHRTGYSPQGCMLMSEHQTAKVSEDIARILFDSTRGLIRVEYQPIEGKQAALSGYWSGTEGGNFRAKACLESTHNLIHNDLAALAMQTGSPSSGLAAPVTTERQLAYINRIIKSVIDKVPHRAELLRLPALDFHSQFFPFLVDYYQFGLNARTDHELEGWNTLKHVINEYTTIPGSDQFFSEDVFLKLPAPSQIAIREAARQDPQAWSRRRNLSPNEVWDARPKFLPIPPVALCDILGGDLAREVTARRGFLEFSDQEISADPLIYQARYSGGPLAGREIGHGEKIKMFVLPFDSSSALVVDARDRYLGEVPLYRRVVAIDPAAFNTSASFDDRPDVRSAELVRAAGEKHSRIADILEPSRILHRPEVEAARDMRAHNAAVLAGEPITPEERSAARTAAALQGQRTAAANRLHNHGKATDWDSYQADTDDSEIRSAWDDLPEEVELPDAL
jgi:hypothetical protein